MEAEKLLCEMTKNLWHCYLLEPTEENYGDIIEACDKKLSMIGTGRHEIFNTAEEDRLLGRIKYFMSSGPYHAQLFVTASIISP